MSRSMSAYSCWLSFSILRLDASISGEDLAVHDRHHGVVLLGGVDVQAALRGETFDFLKDGLLPGVETRLKRGELLEVHLGFEGLGDLFFQVVDDPLDFLGEGGPAAGRQGDGVRAEIILEVVHQAPVVRHRPGLGVARGQIPDDGGFSGALRAGDKNIVAGAVHGQAEFDGLNGPLLADHNIQGGQLRGVFELEDGRVAGQTQFAWFELQGMGHGAFLLYLMSIRKRRLSAQVNFIRIPAG
jgi:hypothetical protein